MLRYNQLASKAQPLIVIDVQFDVLKTAKFRPHSKTDVHVRSPTLSTESVM